MRFQAAVALLSVNAAFPPPRGRARSGRRPSGPSPGSRLRKRTGTTQQSCASCHHQFLPALAFREAREHGIRLDEKIARADAEQAFAFYSDLDRAVEHAHLVDPGIGDAYSLLAADAARSPPQRGHGGVCAFPCPAAEAGRPLEHLRSAPSAIFERCYRDGSGRSALNLLHPASARFRRIEKARAVAAGTCASRYRGAGVSIARLGMGRRGTGRIWMHGRSRSSTCNSPTEDGAALDGRASDAYSTGEILFALSEAGIPAGAAVFRAGSSTCFRPKSRMEPGASPPVCIRRRR